MMRKVTVLIVDDDSSFCEIVSEMFDMKFGDTVEIYCAKDKEEYNGYQNSYFDICIIDNFINGKPIAREIVDSLKENSTSTNIYIATGYSSYDVLKSFINAGISGFIEKNELNFGIIFSKIEEILATEQGLEKIKRKIDNT